MSRFDDNIDALVADGSLTDEQAAALRDASPLKAERDAARAEADTALARAKQLEAKQAADVFTKLSIPGTPDAYRMPDTVDVADEAQVKAWAESMRLITPAGPDPAEQAAHERMNQATQGSNAPPPPNVANDVERLKRQIMGAGSAQMGEGSDLYQRTIDTLREAGLEFDTVEHSSSFERIPEWGSTKA